MVEYENEQFTMYFTYCCVLWCIFLVTIGLKFLGDLISYFLLLYLLLSLVHWQSFICAFYELANFWNDILFLWHITYSFSSLSLCSKLSHWISPSHQILLFFPFLLFYPTFFFTLVYTTLYFLYLFQRTGFTDRFGHSDLGGKGTREFTDATGYLHGYAYISICTFTHVFIYVFIYLSIYVFICTSLSLFRLFFSIYFLFLQHFNIFIVS